MKIMFCLLAAVVLVISGTAEATVRTVSPVAGAAQHLTMTAAYNAAVDGDTIVVGPGSGESTGAVVSTTVMVCDFVEELPHASMAVQVRVTLYSCGQSPRVVSSS